jgi:uncharacterized membrane protein
MTFREMMAWVQVLGVVVVCAWLAWDGLQGGATGSTVDIAIKLLWAVGGLIVFNIVGTIIATILISVVQREVLKDTPADERDDAVSARSQRNSAIVTSIVAALALIPLALGVDPVFAVYALFLAPVAGGMVNAVSELYYYRTM